MALVIDIINTVGTFLTPWYTEKFNAYIIDRQLNIAKKRLNSTLEKKQLTGIRMFESLAQKYPHLAQDIINTLCGWVRKNSPWNIRDNRRPTPFPIVKAIKTITTLPRNDVNGFPYYIDLNGITISGIHDLLRQTNFSNVFMPQCNIINTVLSRSDFTLADLGGCRFLDSSLEFTNFTKAQCCWSAYIEPIRACSIENTEMYGAILKETNFHGANLSGAKQMTPNQLVDIIKNEHTILPNF